MTERANLADLAWTLLNEALRVYADLPRASNWLRGRLQRLDEPVLRIAVTGAQGVGKSTLVDALGGERPARSLRDLLLVEADPIDGSLGPVAAEVDAVLYVMRNRQSRDAHLLRSVLEHPAACRTPVSTIVVLSRADEVGAGRLDALTSARQIARRLRRDPELRPLCQTVVAVAGLIGQAGRTLTETDLAALTTLAAMPRAELDGVLLSADRFVSSEFPSHSLEPLEPAVRQGLLERFGIFGVRLSTTLIRTGFDTSAKLSTELIQRSGLRELREVIRQHFADRRDLLKARSAMLALDTVLRSEPRPSARKLADDLECVLASAHEFRELRLLASLQAGRVKLPGELGEQAQRLVGGYGTGVLERLALDYEPDHAELRRIILDTIEDWQDKAECPMLSAEARQAARIVIRTCEGLLADVQS